MGLLYSVYLENGKPYACKHCKAHLVSDDDLISKEYHGRFGASYLFRNVVNVREEPAVDRKMRSGVYLVSDIRCQQCDSYVGWKYIKSHEFEQRYKEGQYILETLRIVEPLL